MPREFFETERVLLSKRGRKTRRNLRDAVETNTRTQGIRRERRAGAPTPADNFANGWNVFDEILDTTGPTFYKCVDPSVPTWVAI